jgi:hypothetical protein
MLQKKINKSFRYIFFNKIISRVKNSTLKNLPGFFVKYLWQNGNSFLYKKLSFIGLAINIVSYNKFHLSKIKSIMYAAWRSVSAYTFIF